MRVNHDCTLAGLQALVEGRGNTSKTFRFLYMSGIGAERDQNKTPKWAPEYSHMRVRTP